MIDLALKPAFDIPPCHLAGLQLGKSHKFSHPVDAADQPLSAALHRAEQAEAQLHGMQNSRTWRALNKRRNLLHRT